MKAELYRLFFEESSDALLALSLPEGRVHSFNRTFQAMTGFGSDEIQGESVSMLSADLSAEYERERKLDLQTCLNPGFYNDLVLSTKDGDVRFVAAKVRHVQVDGKTLALVMLSDDTERQYLIRDLATKHQTLEQAFSELEKVHEQLKSSQEHMAQSAKLAALGELAAGLSHELNQPLTGVKGFAQEAADILNSDPKPSKKKMKALLNEIVLNSDKMAKLLAHFRSFARSEKRAYASQTEEPAKNVDLSQVYQNVVKLMGRQFENHGIALEFQKPQKAVLATALEHPVEQVLINLLSNSRDAVNRKKELEKSSLYKPQVKVQLSSDDQWVYVKVSDNGGGVASHIKSKIFDPFFTTKEPGKGTGLGLAISYGIAHRFKGELQLESTSEAGSTFVLKLPHAQIETVDGKYTGKKAA